MLMARTHFNRINNSILEACHQVSLKSESQPIIAMEHKWAGNPTDFGDMARCDLCRIGTKQLSKRKHGENWMCIERWLNSFQNGDLNKPAVVREALAYWIYSKSPTDVQSEVASVLQSDDCDRYIGGGWHPEKEQVCWGKESPYSEPVAYFVVKDIFPKPSVFASAKHSPEDLGVLILKKRRTVLFVSNWSDAAGNTCLPEPDTVDCGELVAALGLCGTWKCGATIHILFLKLEKAHKSTWLDSELALFWHPAPDHPDWGMTRSLRTGKQTLREWAVRNEKNEFSVTDYRKRKVEQDYDFSAEKLSGEYWAACKKEIRP